ncbi:UBP-type zinc finger domain-containing protein [Streptomyces sp. NPDC051577]|uniref:UBP-type zinc finger domain-containing protein n=1 Tax=Streptomyces sp. NPDC051577 TaxID=3155166 RepID=UPI0034143BB1
MAGWIVAPDAGRVEEVSCGHLDQAPHEEPATAGRGCEECRATGGTWVHLRKCLICGHIGCCDSSPGRHAWGHADTTDHALARSFEKGEAWAWCYQDSLFLLPAQA